jgi:hypothetical protein
LACIHPIGLKARPAPFPIRKTGSTTKDIIASIDSAWQGLARERINSGCIMQQAKQVKIRKEFMSQIDEKRNVDAGVMVENPVSSYVCLVLVAQE